MKIVIAGASSGLGFETAKLFISAGWKVAVCARRVDRLKPLTELNPDNVTAYQLDICNDSSPTVLQQILQEGEKTDVYFHVAGIGSHNRDLDIDKEINTLNTNALGFVKCIDTAYNYFKTVGGGHIAAISSIAGTKGLSAAPSYSATKRMQWTYLQCLAQLSHSSGAGIKITDIRPGFVKTDLLDKNMDYPLLLKPQYAAKIIYKAIIKKKRVTIIDWKYSVLVFFWKLIPDFVWERLKIDAKQK
ncbi:MAG: SDR family NAD(P)-dependent oxidoreductase [Bacteroidales bacterium]|nr:SDR family NAD(P)-dependent oxidoreductase [Bacteroidales bacterium]